MEFTPQELWTHTGTPVRLVILVMLGMAIWCLWVAIDRMLFLGKGRKQSRTLADAIGGLLGAGDLAGALALVQKEEFKASYLGHLLQAGLKEFHARPDRLGIDSAQRAIERASITEGADLRRGLNILATTGATAPFVGLVGTIFGIINAFAGMAEAGGGGLGAVSAGIAEALVTTAIGITVAILGVWLFNFFTARIEAITNDMTGSMQEFLDFCEKRVAPAFGVDSKDDPATA
jgi:biopolymer transport protein ExbB/TolQ